MVTVWPTPKGSPIASTRSPTCTWSLSAKGTVGRRSPLVSILSTARSVRGSASSTLALNSRLSDSATTMSVPPCHHMIVGEDQAVGAHDHARAQRSAARAGASRGVPKSCANSGSLKKRIDLAPAPPTAGIDIHHRRRDALDDRREGELHLAHGVGHRAARAAARRGGAMRSDSGGVGVRPARRRGGAGRAITPAMTEIVFMSSCRRSQKRMVQRKGRHAAALKSNSNYGENQALALRRRRPPPGRNPGPWRPRRGRRTR